jgi:hypothetical protein
LSVSRYKVTITTMVNLSEGSPSLLEYVRVLENKSSYDRGKQILSTLAGMRLEPIIQACPLTRTRNIIVDFFPNQPGRRLLFSAHYDVFKGSPGANDNASGVAVLLGLCNELRRRPKPVRLVFFDREEAWLRTPVLSLGLLGSLSYVYKTDLRNTYAVYNLEFCGQGDFLAIWPVKGNEMHLATIQQVEKAASRLELPFKAAHIPWLFLSSDHLSFRLRGLADSVTLSLLPSSQVAVMERLLETLSITKLLTGRRPPLLEPLSHIHSGEDTSSKLNENSLELMLSLLLELVESADAHLLRKSCGPKCRI